MLRFFPTLLILIFATSLFAQSNLRKANKQYELYAFNLAIKSYLKVLERHPDNPEALGKLADCYRHLNRMKDAEQWYSKAVQQSGADELFFMQYGEVLKSLGKYEEAKKWFLRYAQKYPVAGTQFAESCAFAIAHRGDVPNYNIQPEYLNTSSSDFSPTIFTSGRVVYASSRKDIRSKRGKSDDIPNNQLFVTRRDENNYLEGPQLLKNTFGSAMNEAPVAYSPDGKTVAITKNNFVEGTRQIPSSGLELSLYFAEVDGNGDWKDIKAYPYNGSGYSTAFGGFSADGNAIYFASDRPDGFGGFDIYISYRVGSSWSAPENLGAAVNTQGNEITPFHDGTYLYFSSDWHKGFGSFDVFIAGQTNGRWNQISNAGTGINTGRDDFGFVYDNYNNVGYLVSNRLGGKGFEDIYRVSRTGSVILKNETTTGITTESTTSSSGGGSLTIEPTSTTRTIDNTPLPTGQTALRIMDAKSGLPLSNVKVAFDNCPVQGGFTQANGRFLLKVASKSNCMATITKIGYATRNIELDSYVAGQSGDIDIYLKQGSASTGSYSGRVADSMSDYFLEGVLVQVTNTASGEILSARTDSNGNYLLPLKSNTAYKFRFSKVGFKDLTLSLTTGSETASKVLETIKITPSNAIGGLSGDLSVDEITAVPPQNSGGIRIEEPTTALVYEDSYAVQIAALSIDKSSNLDGFRDKVGRLGEVYNHIQDGRNKIRVGLYPTREEAASAQKLLRAKGFEGAFIVTQTKKVERTINQSPSQSTVTNETTRPSRDVPPAGIIGEPTNYMVQIAAFKNTGNFDKTKVLDIGVVQEFPKGNLTAIVLSGYDSKEQAQRAVKKAKSRGFKGAYLVQNIGGNLVKAN